ncbi:MAG: hypothetical protein IT558_00410 [Alphaproteobacteria bacterium]|nr:hypothetical protein [Alphaproteobacteria bacterium]
MKKSLIILSFVLNIILGTQVWFDTTTAPFERSGILKENIQIGEFQGKEPLLNLPKGLTVQDMSPRNLGAIDLFEPHRFAIIVTSERELVDYNLPPAKKWGSLYSADIKTYSKN